MDPTRDGLPDPAQRGPTRAGEVTLGIAPGVETRLDERGRVELRWEGRHRWFPARALTVLGVFVTPRSLADGFQALANLARCPQQWGELAALGRELQRDGILRPADGGRAPRAPWEFDSPFVHARLLNDRTRTDAYLRAIRAVVRPGDVVADIGTGSGVLAMAAARAGARQVYAIEGGWMGAVAREVATANGLGDRVTVMEGHSTRVTLPERADVIVSELIGNELLDERVVETIRDARERLARPGARLLPAALRVLALPVQVPPAERRRLALTGENVSCWREWYDLDFGPLRGAMGEGAQKRFIPPQLARDWPRATDSALLASVDLARATHGRLEGAAACRMGPAGAFDGVLVYYEADLAPGHTLSLHPERCGESHWSCPLWVLPDAIRLPEGSEFELRYRYPAGEGQGGLTIRSEGAG